MSFPPATPLDDERPPSLARGMWKRFALAGALSLIGAAVSFALTRYTLGEETPVAVGFARGAG